MSLPGKAGSAHVRHFWSGGHVRAVGAGVHRGRGHDDTDAGAGGAARSGRRRGSRTSPIASVSQSLWTATPLRWVPSSRMEPTSSPVACESSSGKPGPGRKSSAWLARTSGAPSDTRSLSTGIASWSAGQARAQASPATAGSTSSTDRAGAGRSRQSSSGAETRPTAARGFRGGSRRHDPGGRARHVLQHWRCLRLPAGALRLGRGPGADAACRVRPVRERPGAPG